MKKPSNLKRVIVDYAKLNDDILNLLVNKYPYGYDKEHIITFKNAQGEMVDCVEVQTEDTLYLVKVSKRLVVAMEDFDQDDYDEDDDQDSDDFDFDLDEDERDDDKNNN
ncbi:hypothetical protein [Dokdonia sp. Hel_I_53]|uniref:hypothetical protein n=1 Tax=Dokdonia sp. Hel_I_53 TaxID=1566287 RepID=UPI00119ACBFC|nr:hypothetical protein [Dokdonia sp. Hel_I_53]TVZ50902.1 hypothetical protein OD90_0034 [Dokdonia sp. Hel_I_53]